MLHTLLIATLLTAGAATAQRPAPPPPPPPASPPAPPDAPKPPRGGGYEGDRGKWSIEIERISNRFQVGEAGSLRIGNVAGHVVVAVRGGGEIHVEAIKRGRKPKDSEARRRLDDVKVEMRQSGSRVEVDTVHTRGSRAWVDYMVQVPAGTRIDIKSVAGDVKIGSVLGEVRIESVSGNVVATALKRVAVLKSVSGDVQVSDSGSDGEVALASVSGNVVAQGFRTSRADVSTVSGDVVLKACACGQASVQSVSGNILYSGRLEKRGRYEFKSHSGDIRLASQEGFDLEASTFSGHVKADVGLVLRSGDSAERAHGRAVRGAVGGGGAYVEIRTFSGSIHLTKAP